MRIGSPGDILYSPTDLVAFLEGDFAAWMERRYAEAGARGRGGAVPNWLKPDEDDDDTALVKRRGHEHEARVLAGFRARYGDVVEIPRGDAAAALTIEAMRGGAPLIYQGRLDALPWHGYPDFLIRTDTPSRLGAWSYMPSDSKLAHSPKPYFLVQLCAYAELLEAAQGVRPARLGFILGTHEEVEFETERFFYFYRHLKAAFERFQASFDPAESAMPDPALEGGRGRWAAAADHVLAERDDLALVARITRSQIKRLRDVGIRTMAALAAEPTGPRAKVHADVLVRLRRQARLQIASRGRDLPEFEVLTQQPGRVGLAQLAPASALDVYFDLEGFPHAENGLEYLFGAVTVEDGAPRFHDWWAHDPDEERRAFESVVDWLHARWRADPAMHIYHYANYEVNAMRRLMGKYGTRENEVDDLLRNEAFVDLYSVVRQGVAIGTDGYSLKDIEVLCSPARTAVTTNAAGSVVQYQRWLDSEEGRTPGESAILADIRDYNREDCENTWRLADWLRVRQWEAGIAWVPPGADEDDEAERGEPVPAEGLAARLHEAAVREPDDERRRVTQLTAWLLGYHRREDKPAWWRYFDRLGATAEELYDSADCLAGLRRTDTPPAPVKRSQLVEYAFDPEQDTKLTEGSKVYLVTDGEAVRNTIQAMDADEGRLWLTFGPKKAIPDHGHLISDEIVGAGVIQDAVLRFGARWLEGAPGLTGSVPDLLHRHAPQLAPPRGGDLIPEDPELPEDLRDLVRQLDGTTLCIQGPPGSGKTTNAASVIASLATAGSRIGVASNSHKAILNLLRATGRAAGGTVRLLKAGGEESAEELAAMGIEHCESNAAAALCVPGTVLGATAWAFVRPEFEGLLDYLFIDEAGQVSLANAVAMGLAARNIVLMGDQMQLAQPLQGTHPGDSGLSCLHYLLQGHATVPPDRGVFLPRTWRLHPDICRFISDASYDGRLNPTEHISRRAIVPAAGSVLSRGTGVLLEEVPHEGNTQSSEEEAARIAELVAALEQSAVRDGDTVRPFHRTDDLLIVTPYNAQVRLLKQVLGDDIRIASVDKFQGQEANVVIVSMCASNAEETPRGAAFLLDPNRLNVAISRARCLAIVVASDTLIRARPGSVREMELLNRFCRLREYALGAP